jgi:hypothetical protein
MPSKKTFSLKTWVFATWFGWFIGFLLVLAFSVFSDTIGVAGAQVWVGLGMGAGVGLFQSLIILRFLKTPLGWGWKSVLGMGGVFLIGDLVGLIIGTGLGPRAIFVLVAVGGAAAGVLQIRSIMGQSRQCGLWWWISMLGWILATGASVGLLNGLKESINALGTPWSAIVAFLLLVGGGGVLGTVTGLGLKRIMPDAFDES